MCDILLWLSRIRGKQHRRFPTHIEVVFFRVNILGVGRLGKLLMTLVSTAILGPVSGGTHDHIFLRNRFSVFRKGSWNPYIYIYRSGQWAASEAVSGRNREAGCYPMRRDHRINENKLWQNYGDPKHGIAETFFVAPSITNIISVFALYSLWKGVLYCCVLCIMSCLNVLLLCVCVTCLLCPIVVLLPPG
jgi:hypothetical protein